jgi:hypothetical protein
MDDGQLVFMDGFDLTDAMSALEVRDIVPYSMIYL